MTATTRTCRRLAAVTAAAVLLFGLSAPASAQIVMRDPSRAAWRAAMARLPLPKHGCFKASYPHAVWLAVPCIKAPDRTFNVGHGIDFSAKVQGLISSATGSFDSVQGVTDVQGFGNTPNTWSLQLNSSYFKSAAACAGGATPNNCQGWQQFIYTNTGALLVEYWLLNYGPPCPAGWSTIGPSCVKNSAAVAVPVQPLANLSQITLSAAADGPANTDTITLSTGSDIYAMSFNDDVVALAQAWTEAEYNIVGDGGGSDATFNPGSTVVVRTTVHNGTMDAPTCELEGFTSETNNLSLIGSAAVPAAPAPAIVFTQTNVGSALPGCATASGIGDTHLTTFGGLLYDFQAAGDFVLAERGADFAVQTRQVSGAPMWPDATVNSAVGVKMGKTRVALCLGPSRLAIDGARRDLDDGKTLSLPDDVRVTRAGNVYVIARRGGDSVRAELNSAWINVSVGLGHWPDAAVHGLLANATGDAGAIATRGGAVLHEPVAFADLYHPYADSWRVAAAESLLTPCGGRVERGAPGKTFYAGDLDPKVARRTRAVCTAAGVREPALLEACTLDVAVLGQPEAAQVFAPMAPPKAVGKPRR